MHGGLPGRLWRRFIFLKNILINNKSVIYLFMFPPFPMIAKGPKYSSIDVVIWNLEWGVDRFCMLWNCSWSSAILQCSSHEAFLKTAQRIARNIQALQAVLEKLYLLFSHCLSNLYFSVYSSIVLSPFIHCPALHTPSGRLALAHTTSGSGSNHGLDNTSF